ncbi:cytochrome P450 [Fomes fomentarius]|nr:cytochrome P450 [Fomes fomentarius]
MPPTHHQHPSPTHHHIHNDPYVVAVACDRCWRRLATQLLTPKARAPATSRPSSTTPPGECTRHASYASRPRVCGDDAKVAHEILAKRSANYSNRPTSTMINLAGLSWISVLKEYGLEWRQHRRVLHRWFNSAVVGQYRPVQLKITRRFLRGLLNSPTNMVNQLKLLFAATTLSVAYGIEVAEEDDEYFHMVERIAEIGEELTVPGSCSTRQRTPKMLVWARTRLSPSTSTNRGPSLWTMHNGHNLSWSAKKSQQQFTAAFFLAMALYPEVQKKAQQQLDSVITHGRLPEFSDLQALPYIRAIVKELLRWHSVTPIGVPHRAIADDVYNGFLIPAGSIITTNLWAMSRDPETYPDPDEFRPERFLDEHGQLDLKCTIDPASFAFGWGRRICPGRHFAEASMFILCASVLFAFDIKPPVDENGHPVEIKYTMTANAVVSHAGLYDFIIKPRSAQVAEVLRDSNESS